MSEPKLPDKKNATYKDVRDAPKNMVAELLDGDLYLFPRPAGPHASVAAELGRLVGNLAEAGPPSEGEWIFLVEPELRLAEPARGRKRRIQTLVPDIAAYRRARMPFVPDEASFKLPPDWVCEVASPRTRHFDRTKKLFTYARTGVAYVWMVEPRDRTVEVFRCERGEPVLVSGSMRSSHARLPPFDFGELNLALLWKNLRAFLGTHANEPRPFQRL